MSWFGCEREGGGGTHVEQVTQAKPHELRADVDPEVQLLATADQGVHQLHTYSLRGVRTHTAVLHNSSSPLNLILH